MAKYRPALHLVLAFTLLSLTCDLGAVCALAGAGGSCCCPMDMDGAHCDLSGGNDGPSAPAPDATIEASERLSVAILDGASALLTLSPQRTLVGERPSAVPPAESTPLYLSHCAFLC